MKRKKFEVRPVDMCIYIDKHVYTPDCDMAKVYNYLECLVYSLSIKKKMFTNEQDYESFAIFAATELYLRYINERQFLDDDNPRKLKKIKNILDYIKFTLYPLKISYQQSEYFNLGSRKPDETDITNTLSPILYRNVSDSKRDIIFSDITLYLKSICKTIGSIIDETYYASNKFDRYRLYISCIISLLNSITLSNKNIDKLFNTDGTLKLNLDYLLSNIYKKEMRDAIIAWHLPDDQLQFIKLQVLRIRENLISNIKEIISYNEPSEEVIKDILLSAVDIDNKEVE